MGKPFFPPGQILVESGANVKQAPRFLLLHESLRYMEAIARITHEHGIVTLSADTLDEGKKLLDSDVCAEIMVVIVSSFGANPGELDDETVAFLQNVSQNIKNDHIRRSRCELIGTSESLTHLPIFLGAGANGFIQKIELGPILKNLAEELAGLCREKSHFAAKQPE